MKMLQVGLLNQQTTPMAFQNYLETADLATLMYIYRKAKQNVAFGHATPLLNGKSI